MESQGIPWLFVGWYIVYRTGGVKDKNVENRGERVDKDNERVA
jgi:hypothetical protein